MHRISDVHTPRQEWDRIGEEIREMETSVVGMTQYEIVDKLGEGEQRSGRPRSC